MQNLIIFTDGACSSKLNRGGWAYIVIYPNELEVSLSGSFQNVTNNQMELWSCIEALTYVIDNKLHEKFKITLYSDSEYVVKGINEWISGWKLKNWKIKNKLIKNRALWEKLDELRQDLDISFKWVRGHDDNYYNEKVDKLAVSAYKNLD